MRHAPELLTQYAQYHRDRRNIATHFVGVPMIVFGVGVLLARPAFALGGLALSPAWILFALTAAWYLSRGDLIVGVVLLGHAGRPGHGAAAGLRTIDRANERSAQLTLTPARKSIERP